MTLHAELRRDSQMPEPHDIDMVFVPGGSPSCRIAAERIVTAHA